MAHGEGQVPKPGATLRILPDFGGQSNVTGAYPSGAPELVVEVAISSRSRDFGAKKRLYERMGVLEYLIVVPLSKELFGFSLMAEGFQVAESEPDGIYRSPSFPGLWLDTTSL